jgi:hypothetical protein
MIGATNPFPQYTFMAWCSVKAQGQLYLFTFTVCNNNMAGIRICEVGATLVPPNRDPEIMYSNISL